MDFNDEQTRKFIAYHRAAVLEVSRNPIKATVLTSDQFKDLVAFWVGILEPMAIECDAKEKSDEKLPLMKAMAELIGPKLASLGWVNNTTADLKRKKEFIVNNITESQALLRAVDRAFDNSGQLGGKGGMSHLTQKQLDDEITTAGMYMALGRDPENLYKETGLGKTGKAREGGPGTWLKDFIASHKGSSIVANKNMYTQFVTWANSPALRESTANAVYNKLMDSCKEAVDMETGAGVGRDAYAQAASMPRPLVPVIVYLNALKAAGTAADAANWDDFIVSCNTLAACTVGFHTSKTQIVEFATKFSTGGDKGPAMANSLKEEDALTIYSPWWHISPSRFFTCLPVFCRCVDISNSLNADPAKKLGWRGQAGSREHKRLSQRCEDQGEPPIQSLPAELHPSVWEQFAKVQWYSTDSKTSEADSESGRPGLIWEHVVSRWAVLSQKIGNFDYSGCDSTKAIIINDLGEVLGLLANPGVKRGQALRNARNGIYELPGGKRKGKEPIQFTLARELKEELNYLPTDYLEFDVFISGSTAVFLMVLNTDKKIETSREHISHCWFSPLSHSPNETTLDRWSLGLLSEASPYIVAVAKGRPVYVKGSLACLEDVVIGSVMDQIYPLVSSSDDMEKEIYFMFNLIAIVGQEIIITKKRALPFIGIVATRRMVLHDLYYILEATLGLPKSMLFVNHTYKDSSYETWTLACSFDTVPSDKDSVPITDYTCDHYNIVSMMRGPLRDELSYIPVELIINNPRYPVPNYTCREETGMAYVVRESFLSYGKKGTTAKIKSKRGVSRFGKRLRIKMDNKTCEVEPVFALTKMYEAQGIGTQKVIVSHQPWDNKHKFDFTPQTIIKARRVEFEKGKAANRKRRLDLSNRVKNGLTCQDGMIYYTTVLECIQHPLSSKIPRVLPSDYDVLEAYDRAVAVEAFVDEFKFHSWDEDDQWAKYAYSQESCFTTARTQGVHVFSDPTEVSRRIDSKMLRGEPFTTTLELDETPSEGTGDETTSLLSMDEFMERYLM